MIESIGDPRFNPTKAHQARNKQKGRVAGGYGLVQERTFN